MTNVVFILESLLTEKNFLAVRSLLDSNACKRVIAVLRENSDENSSAEELNKRFQTDRIKAIIDCSAAADEKQLPVILSKYMATREWSDMRVSSFVVFSKKSIAMAKAFPNNFCNVDSEISSKDINAAEWMMSQFGTDRPISQQTWFIADTHFFHANIIRYCNRPWNSGRAEDGSIIVTDNDVLRMNNDLIKNWNTVVGKNDIVWHLGDVCFGKKSNINDIVPRLNGVKNLVMGNHDKQSIKFYYDAGFSAVYDHPVIVNGFVILSHVPLSFLNKNTPFYNIAGHVHDSIAYQTWSPTQCIVSVERHNYSPVPWKEIERKYNELQKDF